MRVRLFILVILVAIVGISSETGSVQDAEALPVWSSWSSQGSDGTVVAESVDETAVARDAFAVSNEYLRDIKIENGVLADQLTSLAVDYELDLHRANALSSALTGLEKELEFCRVSLASLPTPEAPVAVSYKKGLEERSLYLTSKIKTDREWVAMVRNRPPIDVARANLRGQRDAQDAEVARMKQLLKTF